MVQRGYRRHHDLLVRLLPRRPAGSRPDGKAAAAAEEPGDEIVVSGIRASLKQAMDIKRDSVGVVDAISAEDIGKLPDQSIAESIARLPGLARLTAGHKYFANKATKPRSKNSANSSRCWRIRHGCVF